MRALLVALLSLLPAVCGSGEYGVHHQADIIIESRGGTIHVTEQPRIIGRLSHFIARRTAALDHVRLAHELAVTEHPRALAAIAAVESGINPQARGQAGERGAWQVRPDVWGDVPPDLSGQLAQAEAILEQLVASSNGDLLTAIRKYNGTGKQARRYQQKILKLIKEI